MTTPLQRYHEDLQREDLSHDPAQEQAVLLLQDLFDRLLARRGGRSGGLLGWLRKLRGDVEEPEMGLYFWGGVGRGKTYLVDAFFECLPMRRKMRIHFHRFMQRIHIRLNQLESVRDPLAVLAREWAENCSILCLDVRYIDSTVPTSNL